LAVWRFVKDIPLETDHPSKEVLEETANSLKNYIETPAIACWGLDDFCFHEGFLQKWEKHWPHLQSHRLEGTGHYLLEDNFEDCSSVIEPFLFAN
jgi:surfactin synthase thioesterase subunit